ncbi:MAG: hypothetical protein CML04_11630 [Pseudozobellia sp.]|nr:hypothetical protein [Pseudozobellia sp.]MBG50349.1 hypothetical protein [Pseudozobellia sp.]MBG50521.1 hypothetical protein [Pseudozobellia sp.]|tara:strand:- start:1023 stop:1715 length:693 start_codon:yes stop_codon:yes gene_type:complete
MNLQEEIVDVWIVDTDRFPDDLSKFSSILTDSEVKRSQRFKFEKDRRLNILARSALRTLSGNYLKVPANAIHISLGEFDKPFFPEHPDFSFNVSHSGTCILLAFFRKSIVGVDVELVKEDFNPMELALNFFSVQEIEMLRKLNEKDRHLAFYRIWTRKEAFIKAEGSGLSFPLNQFTVSLDEKAQLLATGWDANERDLWHLKSFEPLKGYVGALAVKSKVADVHFYHWRG